MLPQRGLVVLPAGSHDTSKEKAAPEASAKRARAPAAIAWRAHDDIDNRDKIDLMYPSGRAFMIRSPSWRGEVYRCRFAKP
jgi:hypothetical protein